MVNIIIIFILIVSIFNPDILVKKNIREKATDDEKKFVANYMRFLLIALLCISEAIFIDGLLKIVLFILGILCLIKLFKDKNKNTDIVCKYKN